MSKKMKKNLQKYTDLIQNSFARISSGLIWYL